MSYEHTNTRQYNSYTFSEKSSLFIDVFLDIVGCKEEEIDSIKYCFSRHGHQGDDENEYISIHQFISFIHQKVDTRFLITSYPCKIAILWHNHNDRKLS